MAIITLAQRRSFLTFDGDGDKDITTWQLTSPHLTLPSSLLNLQPSHHLLHLTYYNHLPPVPSTFRNLQAYSLLPFLLYHPPPKRGKRPLAAGMRMSRDVCRGVSWDIDGGEEEGRGDGLPGQPTTTLARQDAPR